MKSKPTTINDGGPAFPQPLFNHPVHGPMFPESIAANTGGMSLRDWLAGLAMQAFVSSYRDGEADCPDAIAFDSYRQADAMLAERSKR